MSILGKATRVASEWKLVDNSEVKLSKAQLKTAEAVVYRSKYDETKLICRVYVGKEYADFTVDFHCGLDEGDVVNPASIRVYDLKKGDTVIKRLWGEAL